MVFLHGTAIMHESGVGKTPAERVRQVQEGDHSVKEYENYVPVGQSKEKLQTWSEQGAEIVYLSSHEDEESVEKDKVVLERYDFPQGEIYYRQNGEAYGQVVERVGCDVLIEDDCESIGGVVEMTYPQIRDDLKLRIKSIVVREFGGIDHLPEDIWEWMRG